MRIFELEKLNTLHPPDDSQLLTQPNQYMSGVIYSYGSYHKYSILLHLCCYLVLHGLHTGEIGAPQKT